MRKILLDTNIILDIALQRGEFFEQAKKLMSVLDEKNIKMCITATTVTDIYYILRKNKGHDTTITFLIHLFDFIDIVGVDKYAVINALHSSMKDFEDAIQAETAHRNDINIIITRNKKDFQTANLQVFTPTEYLQSF